MSRIKDYYHEQIIEGNYFEKAIEENGVKHLFPSVKVNHIGNALSFLSKYFFVVFFTIITVSFIRAIFF